MSPVLYFSMVLFASMLAAGSKAILTTKERRVNCKYSAARIGGVVDCTTRMGKEQKIAMEMAIQDYYFINNNFDSSTTTSCSKLDLHLKDSQGNPARAAAAGN